MEKNRIQLYGNKAYGVEVSKHGLENGYLDYKALADILGDCILNNTIREATMEDWEIITGEFRTVVFQDYIISEYGYKLLEDLTNELVFYNDKLDVYIWAITHYGTSWDHVLTDVELIEDGE